MIFLSLSDIIIRDELNEILCDASCRSLLLKSAITVLIHLIANVEIESGGNQKYKMLSETQAGT